MASPQENPPFDSSSADSLVLNFPDDSSAVKDMLLWASVLVFLTLVVYWPVTQGAFLWNDDQNVSQNRLLVDQDGLRTIWVQRWTAPDRYPLPQYHPLVYTVWWLEAQIFGQQIGGTFSPSGFHITNLILAAGASVLLWLILHKLKLPGAWMAAALFALHPLNVESVAWISQLATVLAALLVFAAIYTFLFFLDEDHQAQAGFPVDPSMQWGFYAASVLLFVLAMLSKSTAVAMPFLTLLILWWQRRLSARYLTLLIPMILIGIAFAFSAADFEQRLFGANDFSLSGAQRIILAGRAVWFYLGKFFLPVQLSFLYPKWVLDSGNLLQYLPLLGLLIVVGAAALLQKRFGRAPLAAILAFLTCLVPAMGFFNQIPMRHAFVSDHAAYLATVPLIVLLTAGVVLVLRKIGTPKARNNAAIALAAAALILTGSLSWSRSHIFTSGLDLWQDAAAKNPASSFAHVRYAVELGVVAQDQSALGNSDQYAEDLQSAMDQARIAESLDAGDAEAQFTIGRILIKQNKPREAVQYLDRATALDPGLHDAWQDLAAELIGQGQFHQAITKLDEALPLMPQSSPLHRLLGDAYAALGDDQRAAAEFRLALKFKPDNLGAREDFADLLARVGNIKEAKYQYTLILETDKTRADIWDKVGVLSTAENNLNDAITWFQTAVRIDPNNQRAEQHLEMARKMLKDHPSTQGAMPATQPK